MADDTYENRARGLSGATVAGKYRLDRLLGVGGMGAVFSAYHLDLRTDVALKVLHSDARDKDEAINRFREETRRAAQLKHPGICQVTDLGDRWRRWPDGVALTVEETDRKNEPDE